MGQGRNDLSSFRGCQHFVAADSLPRIFQHPLSHNLTWHETLRLFGTIGSVEPAQNGEVVLQLGHEHLTCRPVHGNDLAPDDVMALRHFMARAGWAEGVVPTPVPDAAIVDLVVVIDHAGARVYRAASEDGSAPRALHHLLHHVDRTDHDADREEGRPVDTRYFDAIAAALSGDGRIVVLGHGNGQSYEADHLMAYLFTHHGAVHARVAREIVADLPHLSAPQLLALARHALQPARENGPISAD